MAETVATHRKASAESGQAHAGAELRNDRLSLKAIHAFTPDALDVDVGQADVLQRVATLAVVRQCDFRRLGHYTNSPSVPLRTLDIHIPP